MSVLWVRFPDEASVCPACASSRITVLDVIPTVRDSKGRLVSLVTGCHECGLLFTNPQRSREELQAYYAAEGPWTELVQEQRRLRTKARTPDRKPIPRVERLLSALEPHVPVNMPRPGAKVLDFGCGDGKFLDRLQKRGWDTYGIEPTSTTAFTRHHRLEAPPRDGSFDFVIVHHVLEHIREPLDLLRQLAGALREGGILFVSLPRLDTVPQSGHFQYCLDGRKHLVAFSEACLAGLLARVGLAVTTRLDQQELDDALTNGEPRRLRLVAVRTAVPPSPPAAPLDAAVRALRDYQRRQHGHLARVLSSVLPVRFRAAMMARSRQRTKRSRRPDARQSA